MENRIANPNALGFMALAFVAWLSSMPDAGWYSSGSVSAALGPASIFAGIALLVAGGAAFLRNETWHATFFMFWAAIDWGFRSPMAAAGPNGPVAWFELLIALVSFCLLMAALRVGTGTPVVLLNLFAALSFLFTALGMWLGATFWIRIDGYAGLLAALCGIWASWNAFGAMGGNQATAAP